MPGPPDAAHWAVLTRGGRADPSLFCNGVAGGHSGDVGRHGEGGYEATDQDGWLAPIPPSTATHELTAGTASLRFDTSSAGLLSDADGESNAKVIAALVIAALVLVLFGLALMRRSRSVASDSPE